MPARLRSAPRVLGALLAALVLFTACTGGGTTSTAASGVGSGSPVRSSSPKPPKPSTSSSPVVFTPGFKDTQTTTPIKHVVFLMQENRSFDHMFGRFPGVDGVSYGYDYGM